jgi:hypothetical protein
MEEDSDDNRENIDETFFNFESKKENLLPDDMNLNKFENHNNIVNIRESSSFQKYGSNSNRNKINDGIEVIERSTIKTRNELDDIFRGVNNYSVKYLDLFQQKIVKNEKNEDQILILLKPEQILIILRYIYEILHPFLIDLSDQQLIERIKYFEKDKDTYISIIKQYLSIKDKTFNFILEDLMKKLNISEEIIDSSFSYYISFADKNIPIIKDINDAYDDIIHADYK